MLNSIQNLISLSLTGIFDGITGYVIIGTVAAVIVLAIILGIVFAAKSRKHKENDVDDLLFLANYVGQDGFELPKDEEPVVEEAPAIEEPVLADEASQQELPAPATETVPAPVNDTAPETSAVAPAPAPVTAVPDADNPIAADTVPVEQRQGDWSNYDGEYDGYYYDPVDVCYYEGKAPVYVQKMYLPPVERVVRKIKSPAAPLTDKPKEARVGVKRTKTGLDMSDIYGQYIIEHNAAGEYFFTLYSNKELTLYESHNYTSEQYCRDAIKRFKKHVLVGDHDVVGKDGVFNFILTRKLNTYYGPDKATREEALTSWKKMKYYAQTDIVRLQD